MKKLSTVAFLAIIFVFFSCEKKEFHVLENDNLFSVLISKKGNILSFESNDDFIKAIDESLNQSPEKLLNWSKSIEFESQEVIYNNLIEEYSISDSEASDIQIESNNSELFTFSDEGGITPKVQATIVMPFIDKTGMLYIGNSLYFFNEAGTFIASNEQNLKEIIRTKVTNKEKGSFFYENVVESTQRSACGPGSVATATNSSGNRKGEITVGSQYVWTSNQDGTFRGTYYARFNGTPYKKNWRGKWRNYKTNNTLDLNAKVKTYGNPYPVVGTILYENFDNSYAFPIDYNNSNYWYGIQYTVKVVDATDLTWADWGHYQLYYAVMNPCSYKSQGAPWAHINCQ